MDENQRSIQLLKNIALGSRHSFDLFYEEYVDFVFQIALPIVGDYKEAEDVTHDVFLEVFEKARQYNPKKGSIKAWLAVKTKSRSIDRLRKKKPLLVNKLEGLFEKEDKGADIFVLNEIEHSIIQEALNELPEEQREAIIRSYFNGESHREIAEKMKKPLGSVKSLIRYGINNLRKQKTLVHWAESSGGGDKNGYS